MPPAAPPGCSPERWLAKSADGVAVDHSGVGLGLMLAHEEHQPPLWAGAVRRAVLALTALLSDVAGRADLTVDAVFATACRINVNSHGIRDRAAPDRIVVRARAGGARWSAPQLGEPRSPLVAAPEPSARSCCTHMLAALAVSRRASASSRRRAS